MDREELQRHCQELTVTDLVEVLSSRCVALAMGMIVPDDNNTGTTMTVREGNRCAVLGLATLLKHTATQALLDSSEEEDDDDTECTDPDQPSRE